MKQIVIVCLALMAVLLSTRGVFACSCLSPPINTEENLRTAVETSLRQSDGVFSGEVIEVDDLVVKFKVEEAWKGDVKDAVSMVTGGVKSEDGFFLSSICDYKFKAGEKYLVFANGSKGKLKASKCSWTGILGERERFRNELERLKLLESGSRLCKEVASLDMFRLWRNLTTH